MLRCYLNTLLILALLLQANISTAMQINMAKSTLAHTVTHATNEKTPCHLTVNSALQTDTFNTAKTPNDHFNTSILCCDNNIVCCSQVILPSVFAIALNTLQHSAPITVLFKHLPAPAQRPSKPPRV